MSAKPLVLVDGSSYLYRAFHALPPLTTATGQPTNAVLGVVNMLYKLLDDYAPSEMAVVFDAPGKTFRKDLFSDYKANRPPMPDELRAQVGPLLESIEAMGIPLLRVEGVEADDVIGTLARAASAAGRDTVISTGDKDLAQLVDEHVTLVNTMDNSRLDRAGVIAKFGVTPEQIADYLALIGDPIDNIPGIEGVGPKTAAKWLQQYPDVATLKASASEVPGKIGDRLRAALDTLDLSKELATIRCDVELPLALDDLHLRAPDVARLASVFERLEFVRLLRRIRGNGAGATATTGGGASSNAPSAGTAEAPPAAERGAPLEGRYETVTTDAELERWLAKVAAAPLASLAVQAAGDRDLRAELVGLALAVEPGEAAYVPLGHRYPGAPEQLAREAALARLRDWLGGGAPKVGHDLKHAAHVLANHGVVLGGIAHDTMLESYVLNSTATNHELAAAAARYLGVTAPKYEDVAGKGAKQLAPDQLDVAAATAFAAGEADLALRLHRELSTKLRALPDLARVYTEIEMPLLGVLERMERAGVMVDAQMLRQQSQELATSIAVAERAAHDAAGGPFNLGSPKQLQEILYDKLQLPVLGKTPKGQPSTAESVLEQLAESFDLPRLVLEYRALTKLKSTYTDKLPTEIDSRTGRIHTSYGQAVAATGRLSSFDPNLQNIPVRTPEGRRIRQAFVAAPGTKLIAADYSQIELRIMAHLSGDAGLLAAFAAETDIHRATAAEVFATPVEAVTADQRRSAKAINFGLIYGMSAFGLAKQLGIERGQAQGYVDLYFERYPGVRRYMDETRRSARELGYVTTVFGRRLYLPDINARNAAQRQYAERSAINAPMQGTAADIIKRAMLSVDDWLAREGGGARLLMQVHDELVIEAPLPRVDEVRAAIIRIMESAASLAVPLRVDSGVGGNWDEAH
ncbi:MAG TPA: DNA polymerase I [Gammaproteobacteria bacterium]|nr:DNA polymerase I [Gammaproteobacteria bacterium]